MSVGSRWKLAHPEMATVNARSMANLAAFADAELEAMANRMRHVLDMLKAPAVMMDEFLGSEYAPPVSFDPGQVAKGLSK